MNIFELQLRLYSISLALPKVELTITPRGGVVTGVASVAEYLRMLDIAGIKLPGFEHLRKHTEAYPNHEGIEFGSQEDANLYKAQADQLHDSIRATYDFLNANLNSEPEDAIRITIPEGIGFEELEKFMSDFKIALTLPLRLPEIDSTLVLERGEPGSLVLLLIVVGHQTKKAIKFIAEMCWSATVIRKQQIQNEAAVQHVKKLNLNLEYMETIVNANWTLINKMVEVEVASLSERSNINPNAEQINQLKSSIKTLDELYHKGANIQAGISTSHEIASLFPQPDQLQLVSTRIPLIPPHESQPGEPQTEEIK